MKPSSWLSLSALLGTLIIHTAGIAAEPQVDFQRDVRQILSDNCFQCHGPDEKTREADLRLDLREGAEHVLNGTSGNDGEPSELIRRIVSRDDDERMPPPSAKRNLSAEEIATLQRWVAAGAEYSAHWSFRAIAAQAPPDAPATGWGNNAIDAFVWRQLEREQLQPAKMADRRRLLRRLSFDLTGLPPTPEMLQRFLADSSSDAYERTVDELLDSTAYGERMTSDWLDVARYSDSYGYQVDRDRYVWPWRDWVLRSFNRNLSYDQFITEQLAGDLLPNATDDQILATTFCRLHPQKVEGGSVPEEFRVEYVADRTHTFGTAMLGLTLECCRCHDHKFDPVSQREYYQLFAFFNNIDEAGLYSYFTDAVPTPTLLLSSDEQKQQISDIESKIEVAEARLVGLAAERETTFAAWQNRSIGNLVVAGAAVAAETPPSSGPVEDPLRPLVHLTFDDVKEGPNTSVEGKVGKGIRLTGDDAFKLDVGNFDRFEPFSVALWIKTPQLFERAVVYHRSAAWTDAASRGYELLLEDGRLSAALIHFWPGNALRVVAKQPLTVDEWTHVVVTYDGSSRAAGLKIYENGEPAAVEVVRDQLVKNITGGGGDNISIGERFRDRGFTNGCVDEFRVFARELSHLECQGLSQNAPLAEFITRASSDATAEKSSLLREFYFAVVDESHQQLRAELKQLRQDRSKLVDGIQEIMVMREAAVARPSYLLRRGAYDAPADEVVADTPAALPPLPRNAPRNRLTLARWLTDPQHPLTARVAVNHYWQLLFGEGLVRTPEDFGSQGQPPTHPELLDWLAHDFVVHGWDVKRLLKLIVMSATYQQDSLASPELHRRDPDNLLLARGARFRLPAEMIRDNALATSGLLVNTVGGPPVKPYELTVAFVPYEKDSGPGLYRRSLYTFWKRNGPAPVMMTLDASKRDVCTVRRERTASPLQALVLLNGPQMMEAARTLADQLLTRHPSDVPAAVNDAFERLTSRPAADREIQLLTELWRELREHYRQFPEEATKLVSIGDSPFDKERGLSELAAMTMVVSTIMNYDECVTLR